jgi:hypothetical protein
MHTTHLTGGGRAGRPATGPGGKRAEGRPNRGQQAEEAASQQQRPSVAPAGVDGGIEDGSLDLVTVAESIELGRPCSSFLIRQEPPGA